MAYRANVMIDLRLIEQIVKIEKIAKEQNKRANAVASKIRRLNNN